ncbi:MAG: hypothetical protein II241_06250, partial [Clostridia bacterium]|nr:hypothetical protein [Clostridia bacterium]
MKWTPSSFGKPPWTPKQEPCLRSKWPELIPEYDKVIYSDVDVIFRDDLSEIYSTDMKGYYMAGVNSVSHLDEDAKKYFQDLGLTAKNIIYSGNLIINSKEILNDNLIERFKELRDRKLKFQDMD